MIKNIEEANSISHGIPGVVFKPLASHADDRGFFRELVRNTDPFFKEGFGQWSHSKMSRHTVKAWHFHHRQLDWWYLPFGVIEVVLFDFREESDTYRRLLKFKLGDVSQDDQALTAVVRIPQGVFHGCKVLTDVAHLFYITSQTYDPEDEGRYPFDSDVVPHSWGNPAELIVAPNDKLRHVPKYERIR